MTQQRDTLLELAEPRYPHLRKLAWEALQVLILAVAFGLWGAYERHRGFHEGVEATLCGLRVGLATGGEIPRTLTECRARDVANSAEVQP